MTRPENNTESISEIMAREARQIHPNHSFDPLVKGDLSAPRTRVDLDDSPTGPNEPVYLYRTRGPVCDPTKGLPALRTPWIVARGAGRIPECQHALASSPVEGTVSWADQVL